MSCVAEESALFIWVSVTNIITPNGSACLPWASSPVGTAGVQQDFCAGRFIAKSFCTDQETLTAGKCEGISTVAVCGSRDLFSRASVARGHSDALEGQSPNLCSSVNHGFAGSCSISRRHPRWGCLAPNAIPPVAVRARLIASETTLVHCHRSTLNSVLQRKVVFGAGQAITP
jgi:hypothetical protein